MNVHHQKPIMYLPFKVKLAGGEGWGVRVEGWGVRGEGWGSHCKSSPDAVGTKNCCVPSCVCMDWTIVPAGAPALVMVSVCRPGMSAGLAIWMVAPPVVITATKGKSEITKMNKYIFMQMLREYYRITVKVTVWKCCRVLYTNIFF